MTEPEKTIELTTLWKRVYGHRRMITILVGVVSVATAAIVFSMPPWFQATASLLPPSEEDSGFGIARLLKGVAVPGIKIPTQSTPADVFIAVLDSRRVREKIVTQYGLMKVYERKFMSDAIKDLKSHTKFKLTDAGLIDLSLEDTDPKRAAAMLQTFVDLLDKFNREVRTTKGRRTRLFVEERLTETKAELARSEQMLADYQARHKAAIITPELSTAAQNAARVYAQRTALEVRLGVIRSYTRGSTPSQEEQQIEDQMAQLDRQLAALPETGLELTRMLRDVKKYEQIYILLTAQYEEARIDEARDVVTVDLLDPPQVPERKSRPHRLSVTLIAFMASLGVGVVYALFQSDVPGAAPARRSNAATTEAEPVR